MKDSIKNKILNYLQDNPGWCYGGKIEDFIRQTDGAKASNASRRCRELEDEGKIERQIVNFEGRKVVQYRLKVFTPRFDVAKWNSQFYPKKEEEKQKQLF